MDNPEDYMEIPQAASEDIIESQVIERLFDILLAVFFLIMTLPIMAVLFPAVAVFIGRPVLYGGVRYGKNKSPFVMYKFRTLSAEYESQKEGKLLSYDEHMRLHWFCRFLRESRLDELPQLFNVLIGDMRFIGPRPERPSVYRGMCQGIRNYDKRFEVKPGMIGYSQLFTPHSTPKRIRSFIDNRGFRSRKKLFDVGYLTLITAFAVLERTTRWVADFFVTGILKIWRGKKYCGKRRLDRVRIKDGQVFWCKDEWGKECMIAHEEKPFGTLVDMNEEYVRIDTETELDAGSPMILRLLTARSSAICRGIVLRGSEAMSRGGYTYILKYESISDLNGYFIDQHFLKKSLMKYLI